MRAVEIQTKIDAQDRRLFRNGLILIDGGSRPVVNDYCIESADGQVIVPADQPKAIRIISVPTGRFLTFGPNDEEEDDPLTYDEVTSADMYAVHDNWTDHDGFTWHDCMLVPRCSVRRNVAVLTDAPAEPPDTISEKRKAVMAWVPLPQGLDETEFDPRKVVSDRAEKDEAADARSLAMVEAIQAKMQAEAEARVKPKAPAISAADVAYELLAEMRSRLKEAKHVR